METGTNRIETSGHEGQTCREGISTNEWTAEFDLVLESGDEVVSNSRGGATFGSSALRIVAFIDAERGNTNSISRRSTNRLKICVSATNRCSRPWAASNHNHPGDRAAHRRPRRSAGAQGEFE